MAAAGIPRQAVRPLRGSPMSTPSIPISARDMTAAARASPTIWSRRSGPSPIASWR